MNTAFIAINFMNCLKYKQIMVIFFLNIIKHNNLTAKNTSVYHIKVLTMSNTFYLSKKKR